MHNPQFQAGTSLQSKWEEYEDPIIFEFIFKDEKDAFVRRINHEAQSVGGYDVYQSLMLSRIIGSILTVCAVKCATALLQGETVLLKDADLNDIEWYGYQGSAFSPTWNPVEYTSLPFALQPYQFSVLEKKHLSGMQKGSRPFHTMTLGNLKCCGARVYAPTSKALKVGTVKNTRWCLSLGVVAISKVIKRV
ncbi:hypothetical protein V6N11_037175 [Hibiscus sabdariffa]|uniref:Uncharacterized protein n=1 Tax=Hibiscus sabdariffa TaxID=183260 RepID=A0ABR2P166_9ROSI